MYKKFLITFVLCLGIFGTTAFASTLTPQEIFNKLSKTELDTIKKTYNGPYFYGVNSSKTYAYLMFAPTDATAITRLSNNDGLYHNGTLTSYYFVSYKLSSNTYEAKVGNDSEARRFGLDYSILNPIYSSKPIVNATSTNVVQTLTFPKDPILKEVTIKAALSNLMTAFGQQSKVISTVGVLLLALLLGPSLVMRLVRLFL